MKGKADRFNHVPKALIAELSKVNPALSDNRIIPSLLTKDAKGYRTGGKRTMKPMGFSFTLANGTHRRFKEAGQKMNMQIADVMRAGMHAILPAIEEAALNAKAEVKEREVECDTCDGAGVLIEEYED